MSLRQRLVAKQLPQRELTLSPAGGGDPDVVTVRALPPREWDALVQLHPPTAEQAAAGFAWNLSTFRPALFHACVVSPADEGEPLTEAEWAELVAELLPVGHREELWAACMEVNEDRWPGAELGKG